MLLVNWYPSLAFADHVPVANPVLQAGHHSPQAASSGASSSDSPVRIVHVPQLSPLRAVPRRTLALNINVRQMSFFAGLLLSVARVRLCGCLAVMATLGPRALSYL